MNFEDLMKSYISRRIHGPQVPEWMQDAVDVYFQLLEQPGMKPETAQRIVEFYIV